MDALAVSAVIGGIALFAGLFGGITAKDITIPPLPVTIRILSGSMGVLLIAIVLWLASAASPSQGLQTAITPQPITPPISMTIRPTDTPEATIEPTNTPEPTIVSTSVVPSNTPVPPTNVAIQSTAITTAPQSAPPLPVNVCGEKAFAGGTLLTDKPVFLRPEGYSSGWISADASGIILPSGSADRILDRYVLVVADLPEVQLTNTILGNVYGCWYRSDVSIDQVISQAGDVNDRQQAEAPDILSVLYFVSNSEFKRLK